MKARPIPQIIWQTYPSQELPPAARATAIPARKHSDWDYRFPNGADIPGFIQNEYGNQFWVTLSSQARPCNQRRHIAARRVLQICRRLLRRRIDPNFADIGGAIPSSHN